MNLIYFLIGLIKFCLWIWWTELLKIIIDLFFMGIEKLTNIGRETVKGKDNEVNKIN